MRTQHFAPSGHGFGGFLPTPIAALDRSNPILSGSFAKHPLENGGSFLQGCIDASEVIEEPLCRRRVNLVSLVRCHLTLQNQGAAVGGLRITRLSCSSAR